MWRLDEENPLKPEYARFGSFDQLRENNREQIRLLFEELGKQKAEPGSIAQKLAICTIWDWIVCD